MIYKERERHEDVEEPDRPAFAGIGGGWRGADDERGGVRRIGPAAPWEYKLQGAATPVMEQITWFQNVLFWLITIITLFVLCCW